MYDIHRTSRDTFHVVSLQIIFTDRDIGCTTVKKGYREGDTFGGQDWEYFRSLRMHIDVWHHVLPERVANDEVEVVRVPSGQRAEFTLNHSTQRRFVFTVHLAWTPAVYSFDICFICPGYLVVYD